ncbi:hypothetical protein KBY22_06480 [Ruegeria pomeroyi]|uniref:Uncharacterized protein n=1 Tax=Ruegeria alba TaxID=2916756 RepID=A0ABS9NYJ3_9RHOB|nr:hypothetical protein [Ruegeria pomeroyi]MCE8528838.1 hypothetical protein [Ruegeria pomeroyi]MCG6559086.1 hypothetical protein [Ruegeria alba]
MHSPKQPASTEKTENSQTQREPLPMLSEERAAWAKEEGRKLALLGMVMDKRKQAGLNPYPPGSLVESKPKPKA